MGNHCVNLNGFAHAMPRLSQVDLQFCTGLSDTALEQLVSLCPSLRRLNLRGCSKLRSPDLHSSSVRTLDLSLCSGLESPTMTLSSLTTLELGMCVRLASPTLRVASLPLLDLRNLPIHSLELHRDPHVLRSIDLSGCFNLKAEHIHVVSLPVPDQDSLWLDAPMAEAMDSGGGPAGAAAGREHIGHYVADQPPLHASGHRSHHNPSANLSVPFTTGYRRYGTKKRAAAGNDETVSSPHGGLAHGNAASLAHTSSHGNGRNDSDSDQSTAGSTGSNDATGSGAGAVKGAGAGFGSGSSSGLGSGSGPGTNMGDTLSLTALALLGPGAKAVVELNAATLQKRNELQYKQHRHQQQRQQQYQHRHHSQHQPQPQHQHQHHLRQASRIYHRDTSVTARGSSTTGAIRPISMPKSMTNAAEAAASALAGMEEMAATERLAAVVLTTSGGGASSSIASSRRRHSKERETNCEINICGTELTADAFPDHTTGLKTGGQPLRWAIPEHS